MRQQFSAIVILFVFISLQFGKVATYLYCKWQAEIVLNKPDCGCENHLTAMFDHSDDTSSANELSKNTLSEKLNEFTPKTLIDIPQNLQLPFKSYTDYDASLSESFIDAPFHPPVA